MAITIDDFNKIWASTSPLTPYSFSESNYKEGWNFVGSTPPARQMWDSIQKLNDEKLKYLLDNFTDYLPLAGGTMTGTITLADGGNPLSTIGGTMTGAIVGNPFTLSADDGNDSADLVLNSSGSATWNGKEVERVNASGSGYIRFESGLQICYGSASANSDGTEVTFPVAFISNPTIAISNAIANQHCWISNLSTTNVTLKNGGSTAYNVNYIAVGMWK